jgi:hypothetical protein
VRGLNRADAWRGAKRRLGEATGKKLKTEIRKGERE